MRLGRSGRWRIARGKIFVDLLSDCPELTLLELGDPDPAPTFGAANERGIHQLQNSRLPPRCDLPSVPSASRVSDQVRVSSPLGCSFAEAGRQTGPRWFRLSGEGAPQPFSSKLRT